MEAQTSTEAGRAKEQAGRGTSEEESQEEDKQEGWLIHHLVVNSDVISPYQWVATRHIFEVE